MTTDQYLADLRNAIRSLPPDDAAQAIAYYDEYLHDAADPAAAMAGLGTPKEVAADILAGYVGKSAAKPRLGVLWAVVLGILAAPVAAPIAIAAFAVVLAIVITILAVVVSLTAVAAGIALGGICVTVTGLLVITQNLTTFAWLVGGGLLSIAIGLLAVFGMIRLAQVIIVALTRWVSTIANRRRHIATASQKGQPS